MRVALVRPNMGRLSDGPYVDEGRMEPLELGVLAGLSPPGVECVLHDDRVEAVDFDAPADLAAITTEVYTARRAYEIADEYRSRGVPVVLGGVHAALATSEALAHADAVCVGDAEPVWRRILADARNGRLERVYRAPNGGTPQGGGVLPRRDLFRGKGYLPITLLQFGRGCPFGCEFCAVSATFERRHATRPVREVIAEIEAQDRRLVFFVDDNLVVDRAAVKELLRELIPRRIHWVSQASIDMTEDPALMELLARSGCLGNVIGFESLSPESLQAMRKAPNLPARGFDRYERALRVLRDHGLQTWAAFTLGHDFDTRASIEETFSFAMEQKFAFAAFNILMPYPGTPLYARLAAQGRLLWDGHWWLHPDYRFTQAAFRPAGMTPDELTEAASGARRRWNQASSIVRRLWDPRTHLSSLGRLWIYLRYTVVYAREVARKERLRLGVRREVRPAGRG